MRGASSLSWVAHAVESGAHVHQGVLEAFDLRVLRDFGADDRRPVGEDALVVEPLGPALVADHLTQQVADRARILVLGPGPA